MENDHLKAGEDIHIKWTATSGNVGDSPEIIWFG